MPKTVLVAFAYPSPLPPSLPASLPASLPPPPLPPPSETFCDRVGVPGKKLAVAGEGILWVKVDAAAANKDERLIERGVDSEIKGEDG